MENQDQNEKKPLLDEAEIKRQLDLQKQLDLQRQADEQKLLDQQLREQIEKERQSAADFFGKQADARTNKKKSKSSEDEILKKYLTSIGVTGKKQDEIISQIRQPYVPHFQYEKDYYKEIFRLNAWDEENYKNYYKPREVAVWTVRLIYGRFMKERPTIMDELRSKNKYIGYCVRRHKFFQYLTKDAQDQLDKYIDDCIDMMKLHNDWRTFEVEYCKKYELWYQQHLF